jgi:hypothetical protein
LAGVAIIPGRANLAHAALPCLCLLHHRGKWAITSNDPQFKGTGNPDTGDDYGPAPDLDHANPELRQVGRRVGGWVGKWVACCKG